jgi:hypothetical protein
METRIVGRQPRKSRIVVLMGGVFLASFLATAMPAVAQAGVANSGVGTFTTAGTGYQNYATVATSSNSAYAYTSTGPRSTTVPTGYVGSRGRLFTGGGALSCESTNSYSNQSLSPGGYWGGFSCTRFTSGTWYSYGVSLTYNGSGYDSTYTFQSPSQNS